MSKVHQISAVLAALFACTANASSGQSASMPQTARARRVENGLLPAISLKGRPPLTWSLTERMQNYHVPGLSIAVIEGGQIVWTKGYGVCEQGKKALVTPETRFQAGSASPVGLLTALACVRRGDLDLDEDIAPLLKTWKLPESEPTEARKVTLRTMLALSAGLSPIGTKGYAPDAPAPTPLQILTSTSPAVNQPIDVLSIPGLQKNPFEVSTDLLLIQCLLEDITGKPYAEIARDAVLSPLGMSHTDYADPNRTAPNTDVATGHVGTETLPHRWHLYPGNLEQQLWTTPTDLASVLLEIAQSASGKSERLLSRDLAREIMTPQLLDQGLSFQVLGSGKSLQLLLRGGADGYYTALVLYPDSGQGAVIMTNGQRSDLLADEILRSLAAEYHWPEPRMREQVAVELPSPTPASYEAWYQSGDDPSSLMNVRHEGKRLFIHFAGNAFHPSQEVELFPLSKDCFCYREEDCVLTFLHDPRGQVHGLTFRRDNDVSYFPRLASPPFVFQTPPNDPDPKRTERLRKALVQLARDPKQSPELTDYGKSQLNQLIPLGIADLQPGDLVFLHRDPIYSLGFEKQTDRLSYRIQRAGKTRYYQIFLTGASRISFISEIEQVW